MSASSLKSYVDILGLLKVPGEESKRGGRPASELGTEHCGATI